MSPMARLMLRRVFVCALPLQLSGQLCAAQCSNVTWTLSDSLATCPAGDTLLFQHSPLHPHPSRLRILVTYLNSSCNPRVGVPPESIWVASTGTSGNLKINDKGASIFADDSTNGSGNCLGVYVGRSQREETAHESKQ